MIKFENTQVNGFEAAIRGMRNPKNSWDRSDSYFDIKRIFLPGNVFYYRGHDILGVSNIYVELTTDGPICYNFIIGENDLNLMNQLIKAGPVHRKFLRYIEVYVDITAPLYWWKEFDTYRTSFAPDPFDIEMNSCSTMHKIMSKEFTIDDFSYEHLNDESIKILEYIINSLNISRDCYRSNDKDKDYWWQIIQLLPSSYNQRRTVKMSYETLCNIYQPDCRMHHKLDEWSLHETNDPFYGGFCDWIKTLPYSELITGENGENKA